jgi:hypothetical protein
MAEVEASQRNPCKYGVMTLMTLMTLKYSIFLKGVCGPIRVVVPIHPLPSPPTCRSQHASKKMIACKDSFRGTRAAKRFSRSDRATGEAR